MKIVSIGISFEAKSALKRDFDKGLIPLKRDITGNKLKRGEASIDHTIPKSKGGSSSLNNYSLMNPFINNKRGSKPIKQFINLEALIEYIIVMLDVKTLDVDGIEYLKGWLRTLLRALKQGL